MSDARKNYEVATPCYFEKHGWVGNHLVALELLTVVIVLNAAVISIAMVWSKYVMQSFLPGVRASPSGVVVGCS